MALLVNTPEAEEFFGWARTDTGLNVLIGEERNVEPGVGPEYQSLRIDLRHTTKKVEALASDPTRSDPERHAAAQKLANALIEKVSKTKAAFEKRENYLQTEAFRDADLALGPKDARGALESDIRDYFWDAGRKADGLGNIRAAMKQSEDAARVLYHSPSFLLGLPEDVHDELRMEVLEARRPEAFKNLNAAIQLGTFLPKLDRLVDKIRRTFFNGETAKQASRRVEV